MAIIVQYYYLSAWKHSVARGGLAWIQSLCEDLMHITKSRTDRKRGCEKIETNQMCNREHAECAAQYAVECAQCGRLQCTAFGRTKWPQSELSRDPIGRCRSRCTEQRMFIRAVRFPFVPITSISFVCLFVLYSTATHRCIRLAAMAMLAQRESCCRQNVIRCV